VGKVVMYSSVSVDGFIADENDQPGPLFEWLSAGDVPLDEGGQLKVSQAGLQRVETAFVFRALQLLAQIDAIQNRRCRRNLKRRQRILHLRGGRWPI